MPQPVHDVCSLPHRSPYSLRLGCIPPRPSTPPDSLPHARPPPSRVRHLPPPPVHRSLVLRSQSPGPAVVPLAPCTVAALVSRASTQQPRSTLTTPFVGKCPPPMHLIYLAPLRTASLPAQCLMDSPSSFPTCHLPLSLSPIPLPPAFAPLFAPIHAAPLPLPLLLFSCRLFFVDPSPSALPTMVLTWNSAQHPSPFSWQCRYE